MQIFKQSRLALVAALFTQTTLLLAENQERKNPVEGKPEAVEQGRRIYSNTCVFCHGPEGAGARAPNLVEGLFRPEGGADDTIVYDIILKGRPGTLMGGFEGMLNDAEIWAVVSYLRAEGIKRAKPKLEKK